MLIECNSMRSLIKSANWSRSVLMGMLKELRFNCAMMEDYGTWEKAETDLATLSRIVGF